MSNLQHADARVDQSTKSWDDDMARSSEIDRNTSRDLAVIAVGVLNDAHRTWIAAEADSEQALRAWFEAAVPHHAAAYLAYLKAVDREEAAASALQRLCGLAQVYPVRLARRQYGAGGWAKRGTRAGDGPRSADFE